jgi:FlaG/FlaF family flagellin (archaellin)
MKTTTLKPKELKSNHRAVAPVIATLLMVAIAVVGGTIIFVFSQGFFSSSQISGTPQIEAMEHEDTVMLAASGGVANNAKTAGERIAVYVKNDSVQKITISELRFSGQLYNMTQGVTALSTAAANTAPVTGQFVIWNDPATNGLLTSNVGELQPGETASIVLGLEQNIKIGRDSQFQLKTTNGNIIVGTINVGQKSG